MTQDGYELRKAAHVIGWWGGGGGGGWPRPRVGMAKGKKILFWTFFSITKEKGLFCEGEIGFIEKITS